MRNTPEGLELVQQSMEKGVQAAVAARDGPFGDYSRLRLQRSHMAFLDQQALMPDVRLDTETLFSSLEDEGLGGAEKKRRIRNEQIDSI